jgi:hypothetical protein
MIVILKLLPRCDTFAFNIVYAVITNADQQQAVIARSAVPEAIATNHKKYF